MELPPELLPFENAEKEYHESWTKDRDLCNIPHPFRLILAGPPNSGKSTCIKNILVRADPPFEQVVIISPDPEFSREYEDVKHVKLAECPSADEFPGDKKMLVIMEDLDYSASKKKQAACVSRLFGYVSTHKNVSIALAVQDPIACPTAARRTANFFILAKSPDIGALHQLASKVGFSKEKLQSLFDLCRRPYDTIWIDATKNSPAPIRKNCYQVLKN
jgi:DNA polymerase III delta prime subunit